MKHKILYLRMLIIALLLAMAAAISIHTCFNTNLQFERYPYQLLILSINFFAIGLLLNDKQVDKIIKAQYKVCFCKQKFFLSLLLMVGMIAIFLLIITIFCPFGGLYFSIRFVVAYAIYGIYCISLIAGYLFLNCFETKNQGEKPS